MPFRLSTYKYAKKIGQVIKKALDLWTFNGKNQAQQLRFLPRIICTKQAIFLTVNLKQVDEEEADHDKINSDPNSKKKYALH